MLKKGKMGKGDNAKYCNSKAGIAGLMLSSGRMILLVMFLKHQIKVLFDFVKGCKAVGTWDALHCQGLDQG